MTQSLCLASICALLGACGRGRPFIPVEGVTALATDGRDIFFGAATQLWAVPASGGVPRLVCDAAPDSVVSIALDTDRAVFTTADKVWTVPRSGGIPARFAIGWVGAALLQPVIDGPTVWLAADNAIGAVGPSGALRIVAQGNGAAIYGFDVGASDVYWRQGYQIRAVAKAGGTPRIIDSTGPGVYTGSGFDPRVGERFVYYSSGFAIRAAPLAGGAPFDVARPIPASPLAFFFYLAVEGSKVLFVTAIERPQALPLVAIDEADPAAPDSFETLAAPAPRVLSGFASAGGVVYWAEPDGIYRASVR